jgi:hypothetical protein
MLLRLINSTIVQNDSLGSAGGGGIRVTAGSLKIDDSTIKGNVDARLDPTNAGGISFKGFGIFTMNNTVVAENYATGAGAPPDIRSALIVGSSGNFIGIGTAELTEITNGVNSNQIGTTLVPLDAELGPLQNNGGPTKTRLPRSTSPLLNAGVNDAVPSGLTIDQRGFPRIVDGRVNIGAVERG